MGMKSTPVGSFLFKILKETFAAGIVERIPFF